MSSDNTLRRRFFERQLGHFVWLVVLLVVLYTTTAIPGFGIGGFLGLSTTEWVVLTVVNMIMHQMYVWICWRAELHWNGMSRVFGDKAFSIYAAVFFVFLVLRPILIFMLGWANRDTLPIEPWIGYAIALVLFLPIPYLGYSIVHFFGFARAAGLDHFNPAMRSEPLVREGIFAWAPNAMYIFGFLFLWIPAFLFQSVTALVVAAFGHAYIWVHYFFTEKPDMQRIYG